MNDSIVVAKDVYKRFDDGALHVEVLKGVNLEVATG